MNFIHIATFVTLLGLLSSRAIDATKTRNGNNAKVEDLSAVASVPLEAAAEQEGEVAKDKRQVGSKETSVYPNHRSDTANSGDDPEDGQETIYGAKPNQFIIRPIAPHQHQQHEGHQEPQLRNYAAANPRPHAAQLLEQSQEVQHFVYLQDVMRHQQPKALVSAGQSKSSTTTKKTTQGPAAPVEEEEEAEQRYAVAVRPQPHPYASPYQLSLPVPAPQQQQHQQQLRHQQQQQQQPQSPYQIIPEEQFLKLLEEELQARAYHEAQQQQQHQHPHQRQHQLQLQHQQHQQPPQYQQQPQPTQHSTAATHKILQQAEPGLGLGGYRERIVPEQELVSPQYVAYPRGGPKYLPRAHSPPPPQQQQSPHTEDESQPQHHHHHHHPQQQQQHQQLVQPLPPQIAYYQPQITYKTLPNHPLAKSSLESEIEKLLAANKPSPLEFVDNANEPTLFTHQNQHQSQPRPSAPSPPPPPPSPHPALRQPKAYIASTTPNSLLDANNQPFIPSLFKFSSFQPPTPIYPQPVVGESKKVGPVVYPQATGATVAPQPTQYYYQEAPAHVPTVKPKHYRSKLYGHKLATPSPTKAALIYDYNHPQSPQNFSPSPPDPIKHLSRTLAPQPSPSPSPTPSLSPTPAEYQQYVLPSQSSIYVSQGTGIASPSRASPIPIPAPTHKLRTVEELKQLNLPPPNGKPLTQAEFQALVDAGYPVKAVPVPVPVPYEQYVKDHPEYRNHPPVDYAHLMRLATRQLSRAAHLASPSEPSVKIVSSPAESQQTATAIGGGSVTYLQPIEKRRPRDEKETAVAGATITTTTITK